MCIHFTFENVLQPCLSFLRSLLFYFLASLMAFSVPWKCRYFQSSFISMVDLFSNSKDVQNAMEQSWRFLLHMDNHFSSTVGISTNQRNSILVHLVDWLFNALQTLANQWLPYYHLNMISSNILFLGSFFAQHRPLTLFGLNYTIP